MSLGSWVSERYRGVGLLNGTTLCRARQAVLYESAKLGLFSGKGLTVEDWKFQ